MPLASDFFFIFENVGTNIVYFPQNLLSWRHSLWFLLTVSAKMLELFTKYIKYFLTEMFLNDKIEPFFYIVLCQFFLGHSIMSFIAY